MRIEMASPKPLPTPAGTVGAMRRAGDLVTGPMSDWPEFPFNYGGVDAEHPKFFPHVGATDAHNKRGRAAANMHWAGYGSS